MEALSIRKKAKRKGIWITSGKHPPRGFTPCFLYSAITSSFIFDRLGSVRFIFLYLSLMAFI